MKTNDKDSKGKELKASVDAAIEALATQVDEVKSSETFQAFLDMQSKLHSYSFRNIMLIASQKPNATMVAGFKAWQTKFKRCVKKGEKGIAILAPIPASKTITDDNGEQKKITWMRFRVVHVYDVSQTDGEPLPTFDVPSIQESTDSLLKRLVGVAMDMKITVAFLDLGDTFGVSKKGHIDINNTHTTGQQAKTMAHELGHEILHGTKDRAGLTKAQLETEAESIAYVVCHHFGLDVATRASRYIACWRGDAKLMTASMDRIGKTAKAIIEAVDAQSNEAESVAA